MAKNKTHKLTPHVTTVPQVETQIQCIFFLQDLPLCVELCFQGVLEQACCPEQLFGCPVVSPSFYIIKAALLVTRCCHSRSTYLILAFCVSSWDQTKDLWPVWWICKNIKQHFK